MKNLWLSKKFGLKAGIGAATLALSAVGAAVYAFVPEQIEKIVYVKTPEPPKPKPKLVPKAAPPAIVHKTNLFIQTSDKDKAEFSNYIDFCKEYEGECGDAGNATAVLLSDNILKLMSGINVSVNKVIEFKDDNDLYGGGKFAIPTSRDGGPLQGDCDDYTLTKAKLLRQYIPRETMMMALVGDKNSKNFKYSHAVLLVRTTGGDFILDNRHEEVILAKDSEYRFWFATKLHNEAVIAAVVPVSEERDTAALNDAGLRAFNLKIDKIPSVEDVRLALAPASSIPKTEKPVSAQSVASATATNVAVSAAPAPITPAPAPVVMLR